MNNTSKNKKAVLRMLLGTILALMLIFCTNGVFWAVGIMETAANTKLIFFLDLIFVCVIEVILWIIGFRRSDRTESKE